MSIRPQAGSSPTKIGDRYEVISELGSGAVGTVYRCRDLILDIDVAIKLLHTISDPNAIVRFQKEAKAAARLKHTNVAGVLDFTNIAGQTVLIMEYIDGQSLAELIASPEKLSIKNSLEIFLDLIAGLEHAHANGIIHRDLKPSNVIVSRASKGSFHAKIVDFGTARLNIDAQALTRDGACIGTPIYMSPEQAGSGKVDERSDIYSLGCIMFELLCGSPPIVGENALETLRLKRETPAESVLSRAPSAPPLLADVIDKCLLIDPAKRFQSMKDLRSALALMSSDLPQPSQPPPASTISENLAAKTRMHFVVKVVIGSTAFLLLACLAWIFRPQEPAPSPQIDAAESPSEKLGQVDRLVLPDPSQFVKTEKNDSVPINLSGVGNPSEWARLTTCQKPMEVVITDMKVNKTIISRLSPKYVWSLRLEEDTVTDEALRQIGKVRSLKRFSLIKVDGFSPGSLRYLKELPELDYIKLEAPIFTNDSVKPLESIRSLRNLCLWRAKQIDDGIAGVLARMTDLTLLSLNGTGISSDGIKRICTDQLQVRTLELRDQELDDSAARAISRLPCLRILILSANTVSAKQLEILSASPPLTILILKGNGSNIEDRYRALENFKGLKELHLNDLAIKRDKSGPLAKLYIRKLSISRCNFSDADLLQLESVKTLDDLQIEDCGNVTRQGIEAIRKAFRQKWHKTLGIVYESDPTSR